ncbi:hypothetical protein JOD54_002178 [Actinokineospora baliensis]|uniref:Gp19/Gp15/Gp42 family protein n=1 Tax=Actinokineospora baliensis TaxID=547056 RepID=UPI00195A7E9B|nr:Gp19/Gp15/Gp42 family protein [Actinokineospora baliensis]MBM7771974.1 hypothetical protein [Actinokineospora baliensis]
MAYATSSDVEDRLGRELDDSETQIVYTRLEDAETLILAKIPDLHTRVTANTVPRSVVTMIEADAVLRLLRNPNGFSGETDGNYSYQLSRDVASGKLEILDSEWALLGIRRKRFVIAPRLPVPTFLVGRCCNPNYPIESCLCLREANTD